MLSVSAIVARRSQYGHSPAVAVVVGNAVGDALGDTVQRYVDQSYPAGAHAVLAESESWMSRLLQSLSAEAPSNIWLIEVTLTTSNASGWLKAFALPNTASGMRTHAEGCATQLRAGDGRVRVHF
jgi:hypothetical protein